MASSTGGIIGHLQARHNVRDPAEIESDAASQSTTKFAVDLDGIRVYCETYSYRTGLAMNFDQNRFRQRYIDWAIRYNISFYTAIHPDTLSLLYEGAYDILKDVLLYTKSILLR